MQVSILELQTLCCLSNLPSPAFFVTSTSEDSSPLRECSESPSVQHALEGSCVYTATYSREQNQAGCAKSTARGHLYHQPRSRLNRTFQLGFVSLYSLICLNLSHGSLCKSFESLLTNVVPSMDLFYFILRPIIYWNLTLYVETHPRTSQEGILP